VFAIQLINLNALYYIQDNNMTSTGNAGSIVIIVLIVLSVTLLFIGIIYCIWKNKVMLIYWNVIIIISKGYFELFEICLCSFYIPRIMHQHSRYIA